MANGAVEAVSGYSENVPLVVTFPILPATFSVNHRLLDPAIMSFVPLDAVGIMYSVADRTGGGEAIVIEYFALAACGGGPGSVTLTITLYVPAVVGVQNTLSRSPLHLPSYPRRST